MERCELYGDAVFLIEVVWCLCWRRAFYDCAACLIELV